MSGTPGDDDRQRALEDKVEQLSEENRHLREGLRSVASAVARLVGMPEPEDEADELAPRRRRRRGDGHGHRHTGFIALPLGALAHAPARWKLMGVAARVKAGLTAVTVATAITAAVGAPLLTMHRVHQVLRPAAVYSSSRTPQPAVPPSRHRRHQAGPSPAARRARRTPHAARHPSPGLWHPPAPAPLICPSSALSAAPAAGVTPLPADVPQISPPVPEPSVPPASVPVPTPSVTPLPTPSVSLPPLPGTGHAGRLAHKLAA